VLIRVTSTLTADDENRQAPAVLRALSEILNVLPIAYAIRIDTADAHVYAQSRAGESAEAPAKPDPPKRATVVPLDGARPLRN